MIYRRIKRVKDDKKGVGERGDGGLDRGQTDERTHWNKGSVILLSERKIGWRM